MSKEFFENPTCTMKAKVYLNRDGNIAQPGETITGQKTVTFSNFASSITASETVNDENSSALHNGVSGLIWLLSGTDENLIQMLKNILSKSSRTSKKIFLSLRAIFF